MCATILRESRELGLSVRSKYNHDTKLKRKVKVKLGFQMVDAYSRIGQVRM